MATIKAIEDAAKDIAQAGRSDVEEQLKRIQADIASLAKTVGSIGANKADDYASRAGKVAGDAVSVSQNLLETIRAEAGSLEARLERQIRDRPLQTVGIAASIGILFALLSRR